MGEPCPKLDVGAFLCLLAFFVSILISNKRILFRNVSKFINVKPKFWAG